MDSVIEQVRRMAGTQLAKFRWALGINGALSIVFAATILIWPDLSLFGLTILFGVYAIVAGIVGVALAIRAAREEGRGWLAVTSLLGIVLGVLVLAWPDISALALLYMIGAYALALGLLAVVGAFLLPLDSGDRSLLVLSGLVSIVFGIVMFAEPGGGALVLLALIAAFALVTGISELVVAIGWERLFERRAQRFAARAEPKTSA
jgi:uncharacterized membrane protein HdeD (DUF308 family)